MRSAGLDGQPAAMVLLDLGSFQVGDNVVHVSLPIGQLTEDEYELLAAASRDPRPKTRYTPPPPRRAEDSPRQSILNVRMQAMRR